MANHTLMFYYRPGQLTKGVNVVFTLENPTSSELSIDQNRVAWRVATLKAVPGSAAINQFSVEYSGRLGFGINEHTVLPTSMVEIEPGQITELTLSGSAPVWSNPSVTGGIMLRATNRTGRTQHVAVGTVKDTSSGFPILSPTFLWKVSDNITAEAKVRPILKMYVNLDYRQNDFITDDLRVIRPVWTENLADLPSFASFSITETPQGQYAVCPLTTLQGKSSKSPELRANPPSISINFRCRLNWEASVGRAVVGATFTSIAKSCTNDGCTYTEAKNDYDNYRTISVSNSTVSAEGLHRVMINAIIEGIKQGSKLGAYRDSPGDAPFSEDDIDRYWRITDEVASNVTTSEDREDVIVEGSAAWYHLR
ncbi:hypothetical protein AAF712_006010 [Marasmius tenuissimus]|uniref:Uncharacterized protein n=1 Tax=Marasmius tenuissimus TaxID=585030 RepID=A0ABR3A0Z6_9AGAR